MRKDFFLLLLIIFCSISLSAVVNFSFVGDVMFPKSILEMFKTPSGYDFKPIFSEVKDIISSSDIAFCNLETTLGGPPYTGVPKFSSPDEVLEAIHWAGFDVVNVSNNHMLDTGTNGLRRTIQQVRNYGFTSVGGRLSPDEPRYSIVEVNGVKISFAGFTFSTNGIPIQREYAYMFDYINDHVVLSTVKQMRQNSDIVVVHFHFGVEFMRNPTKEQERIAKLCIENGADIVVGSHPHVLQRVDVVNYNGKKKVIAYSLGNFVSNMLEPYTDVGVILNVSYDTEQGAIVVNPIITWRHRFSKNGKNSLRIIPVLDFVKKPDKFITKTDLEALKKILENTKLLKN
ncbi:MAG: CapA family protein [Fervidobacterium sp.]|nr:CapA family protein [Fervidobacterium sp.]